MRERLELKTGEVKGYSEQIFSPYQDERMEELIESVKANGVITPIIVRESNAKYEVLSGHMRVEAAKLAGLETIPGHNLGVIEDSKAKLIVTESNISQRGFMELSVTERAHCIYVRHEAMKKQGVRNDLVKEVNDLLEAGESVEEIKVENEKTTFNLNKRVIRRYVRVHMVDESLKDYINKSTIGVTAAEILSYLEKSHQELLAEVIEDNGFQVNEVQARKLRTLEKNDEFTQDKVFLVLFREEAAEVKQFKLSVDIMKKYFAGYKSEDAMKILDEALGMWFKAEKGESA